MREIPDSQLPRDPEYWESLGGKIREDAAGPLAAYAAERAAAGESGELEADAAGQAPRDLDAWYGELDRKAPWLIVASAAAMLILWLSLPAPVPPAPDSSVAFRWMERSLGPDEVAGTLVSGPVPPSVDALMVQFSPALYSPDGSAREGRDNRDGLDDPDDFEQGDPR